MNTSTVTRFTTGIRHSMLALAILGAGASHSLAQDDHSQTDTTGNASAFLKIVRDSTERFNDVRVAMAVYRLSRWNYCDRRTRARPPLHPQRRSLTNPARRRRE